MTQTAEQTVRRVRTEPNRRRVRVFFGGEAVADSSNTLYLFETGHLPVYYFPRDDVRFDLLETTSHHTHCPYKGDALYYTVVAGGRRYENAVWAYPEPIDSVPELRDYVAFYWDQADAWYEEDDEVFVHARDPYHRVDVLNSSRHVQVLVNGVLVAESRRPRLLFETGLPVRYYLPKLDVQPVAQAYTSLAPDRVRFESLSRPFTAELEIDGDGLVLHYPGLFTRVAG